MFVYFSIGNEALYIKVVYFSIIALKLWSLLKVLYFSVNIALIFWYLVKVLRFFVDIVLKYSSLIITVINGNLTEINIKTIIIVLFISTYIVLSSSYISLFLSVVLLIIIYIYPSVRRSLFINISNVSILNIVSILFLITLTNYLVLLYIKLSNVDQIVVIVLVFYSFVIGVNYKIIIFEKALNYIISIYSLMLNNLRKNPLVFISSFIYMRLLIFSLIGVLVFLLNIINTELTNDISSIITSPAFLILINNSIIADIIVWIGENTGGGSPSQPSGPGGPEGSGGPKGPGGSECLPGERPKSSEESKEYERLYAELLLTSNPVAYELNINRTILDKLDFQRELRVGPKNVLVTYIYRRDLPDYATFTDEEKIYIHNRIYYERLFFNNNRYKSIITSKNTYRVLHDDHHLDSSCTEVKPRDDEFRSIFRRSLMTGTTV